MWIEALLASKGGKGEPLRCRGHAGSERVGETGAVGEAAKEGNSINVSLLYLGKIIKDLHAGHQPTNIVYRNSKMTHLLQVGPCEGAMGPGEGLLASCY